jgi:hypothetical protein
MDNSEGLSARTSLGGQGDVVDHRGDRIGSAKQVPGLVGFLCAKEESVYMGGRCFNEAASLARSCKLIGKTAKCFLSPALPLFAGFARVHRVRRERRI